MKKQSSSTSGAWQQLIVIFFCFLFLVACQPNAKKIIKTDWSIRGGSGMPSQPRTIKNSSDLWYFDFPATGKGTVNYITVPYTGQLSGSITISLTINTTGSPSFDYGKGPDNSCPHPATVRPYIEHVRGVDCDFCRWWSNQVSYVLKEGSTTLSVPIDPAMWSSVRGMVANQNEQSLQGFVDVLRSVGKIGMTFGGGCFYGHGVSVSGGTARFILNEYKVVA